MTTDITELARERLKEKFDVWFEREYKHLESSKYTDTVPHIKYGFWTAYQAGGAELVEALEKAQQRIIQLEPRTVTVKLPDYRNTYKGPFADEVEHQVRLALELFSSAAGIKWEAE